MHMFCVQHFACVFTKHIETLRILTWDAHFFKVNAVWIWHVVEVSVGRNSSIKNVASTI